MSDGLRGNILIRFLLEACLDIAICIVLQLYYSDLNGGISFGTTFEVFNSVFSILLGIATALFLPVSMVFYLKNFKNWGDEVFASRYGAFYDGLRTDRKSSLLFHIIFLIRRFAFTMMAIYAGEYLFVQIWVLLATSTMQVSYLFVCRPFDSEFMNNIEIFNELTTIVLTYVLIALSPANQGREASNEELDLTMLGILGSNIMVHTFFLLMGSVKSLKDKIKSKCCKSK